MYNKIIVKNYLRSRVGFCNSRVIATNTAVSPSEMRALCNRYPQTFISSPAGYKLIENASGDEIEENVRSLLARAEKIQHRARSLHRFSIERNKIARRLARVAGQ